MACFLAESIQHADDTTVRFGNHEVTYCGVLFGGEYRAR